MTDIDVKYEAAMKPMPWWLRYLPLSLQQAVLLALLRRANRKLAEIRKELARP